MYYPRFIHLVRKATTRPLKQDILLRLFTVGIQTKLEHERLLLQRRASVALPSNLPDFHFSRYYRHENLKESWRIIIKEMKEKGPSSLSLALKNFNKENNKLNEIYQTFIDNWVKVLALLIEEELEKEKTLKKWKNVYEITPEK